MPLVKVLSTEVRDDINRKTGEVRGQLQRVGLIQGGFALPFDVPVTAGKPYPVGDYSFSPESFKLNQFGGLELNRYDMTLVPVPARAAAPAAPAAAAK